MVSRFLIQLRRLSLEGLPLSPPRFSPICSDAALPQSRRAQGPPIGRELWRQCPFHDLAICVKCGALNRARSHVAMRVSSHAGRENLLLSDP